MRSPLVLMAGSLFVVVLLLGVLAWISQKTHTAGDLSIYCAAGLRGPVDEVAAQYEEEYGVSIEFQYGGSQTLLSQLEINRDSRADIYIAADAFYVDLAKEKGLVEEILPIAEMRPVLVVQKANPKGIRSIDDLTREDVRVALGNPEQSAVGKAVKDGLTRADKWDRLSKHVIRAGVFKPTVNEVANDVKIGAVDAGIIWNSVAAMPEYRDDFTVLPIPELKDAANLVSLSVLASAESPPAALRFARYLAAADRGLQVFKEYGFKVVEGDVWAEHPEITFFCGSVNRRAVEEVIKEFEKREGITVNTVYNGCGILTGQMRIIDQEKGGAGFPDVYMACDRYYLDNVKDWFQEDADISSADIVIAVLKGNPKDIQSVDDLTKPGLRVAIGQGEQCTIGALTRNMLEKMGVYEAVMKNVVHETPTSALLVPDVTTKAVDAAIAYVTDTRAESDKVDTIYINSEFAKAVQPFAIAKSSQNKYLGRRLFQRVTNAQERFESAGFNFVFEKAHEFGIE